MKRLIEQTACDHGKWEEHCPHGVNPGVTFRCHFPCPGGSSREITVDYEAAAKMEYDPDDEGWWERLRPRGREIRIEDARRLVDAALGGGW